MHQGLKILFLRKRVTLSTKENREAASKKIIYDMLWRHRQGINLPQGAGMLTEIIYSFIILKIYSNLAENISSTLLIWVFLYSLLLSSISTAVKSSGTCALLSVWWNVLTKYTKAFHGQSIQFPINSQYYLG